MESKIEYEDESHLQSFQTASKQVLQIWLLPFTPVVEEHIRVSHNSTYYTKIIHRKWPYHFNIWIAKTISKFTQLKTKNWNTKDVLNRVRPSTCIPWVKTLFILHFNIQKMPIEKMTHFWDMRHRIKKWGCGISVVKKVVILDTCINGITTSTQSSLFFLFLKIVQISFTFSYTVIKYCLFIRN